MKIEVLRPVQIIVSAMYEREWYISMKGNQNDGFESSSANLNGGDSVAHQYDDDGGYHQDQNDDSDPRDLLIARIL